MGRALPALTAISRTARSRKRRAQLWFTEPPEELNRIVVERMEERYRRQLPLVDGAVEAVRRLAERWPLGLASSSNRPLIDLALELMGVAELFRATVSSDEVDRGKPAPDVYLEAARRLSVSPENAVAVEDSASGIRSAKAAGMGVVAIPNAHFPPPDEVLQRADVRLDSLAGLTPDAVESASFRP